MFGGSSQSSWFSESTISAMSSSESDMTLSPEPVDSVFVGMTTSSSNFDGVSDTGSRYVLDWKVMTQIMIMNIVVVALWLLTLLVTVRSSKTATVKTMDSAGLPAKPPFTKPGTSSPFTSSATDPGKFTFLGSSTRSTTPPVVPKERLASSTTRKHEKYYFADGNMTFLVSLFASAS